VVVDLLGVVTTDTYDPNKSGRLQNDAGLPKPWIQPDGGVDPALAFVSNASVGTSGSGDEKGLLAGMMALTPPLESSGGANCSGGQCFLRSDAQLYTIILSDEEDSSCAPIRSGGYSSEEGCDNAAANLPGGFGSIEYWSRFYSGIKGPGGVSRVAAITGTDSTFQICKDIFAGACDPYIAATASKCVNAPDCKTGSNDCCQALSACSLDVTGNSTAAGRAIWCEVHQVNAGTSTPPFYLITGVGGDVNGGFPGCVAHNTDGGVAFTAYYAERYTSVAKATGGVSGSICDQDYTPSLEKLGLQASGQRSEFPLSRAPVAGSIVVTVNGVQVAGSPATWQYVECENGQPVNSIRFAKGALPPPDAKVAVSYDVNVKGIVCK
jgi:hypothetical protein